MAVFDDLTGRSAGPATLRLRGLAVAVAAAVLAGGLTAYAQGAFDSPFGLTLDAASVGDGLTPGSEVKFRGVSIGTVDNIETVGFGRQRLQLEIDPSQAGELTDTMQAQFSSSNVFGSTAIELVSDGTGSPLAANSTLEISGNQRGATVTGVFRRVADLTAVLDTDQVQHLLDVISNTSVEVSRNLKPYFDTAQMMADHQIDPLAWKLHRGAELGDGIANLIPPLLDLVVGVVDKSVYVEAPEDRARTIAANDGLSDQLMVPVGDLLKKNNPDLTQLLSTTLDLLVPITASIGTFAPSYNRVPQVLDGISDAFPIVDGKPQLQLDLIVETMPNLAGAVAAHEEANR
ncbi:mammalian cell entry protein [Rhodococcus sp. 14-2483-1-1]|uniref:MlaD family protein n=1 Tax=unclassified Rhodococcus (in: high G+C Gram-positive bacteria) TaxID=192944 RepID=UPI000B9B0BC5|nr:MULTISPECIES: MlaD family protein [unclassified Rhodococcus (in: high G+C Gram-positive bacteria)]OZE80561.1 mammalian cell entry protein [Rhodococcus sp. 15-649-2-2]OZF35760.1 mammalian cell entry protein [Rhodococcus sp. 14-2483-1-1]